MSKIMDASSKMGSWMLRGWVLTDRGCPKCHVPLMRSPNDQTPVVHFCVSCDGDPSQGPAQSSEHRRSSQISGTTTVSTHPSVSRASTPPTDIPSDMDPLLLQPVIDTEDILRRRQQSDRASAEIGSRLLKGWAMLADECPGPGCYGVPLVRPPKPRGGKDPRKECVICGSIYVDEQRLGDLDHSITQPRANPAEEPVNKAPLVAIQPVNAASTSIPLTQANSRPQGLPSTHSSAQAQCTGNHSNLSTISALESAERALQASLQALADALNRSVTSGTALDPRFIGDIAEAIQKVTAALTSVRLACNSERPVA